MARSGATEARSVPELEQAARRAASPLMATSTTKYVVSGTLVAERRLDARPDLCLVAPRGPDDLEDDGVGADGRDPEQLPLGAERDQVAGPGAAADRPEAELGPAGLGPLDRRVRLPSHEAIVSTGNTLALPPFGPVEPA